MSSNEEDLSFDDLKKIQQDPNNNNIRKDAEKKYWDAFNKRVEERGKRIRKITNKEYEEIGNDIMDVRESYSIYNERLKYKIKELRRNLMDQEERLRSLELIISKNIIEGKIKKDGC